MPYQYCFIFGFSSLVSVSIVMIYHLLKIGMNSKELSKNRFKCQYMFIPCFSLLSVSGVVNSSPMEYNDSITFRNFSEKIVLHKVFEQQYMIEGTRQKVTLSNRLIVKTSQTKAELFQSHTKIAQITELFQGTTFNYFSLILSSDVYLADVLMTLQKLDVIELVQPDILQLKPTPEPSVKSKAETLLSLGEKNKKQAERIARRDKITAVQQEQLAPVAPYLTEKINKMWQTTLGGEVNIAIIDDGFDLQHSDLHHVKQVFTYDVENNDTTVKSPNFYQQHGTQVAGIIFAEHNQQGIDGIAPQAGLIAIRQPSSWTSNTLLAFQLAQLAGADIINNSWHTQHLFEPIADVVNDLAVNGRKGLGVAVVFSAGNSGIELPGLSNEALIDKAIVVGAIGKNGQRLASSNFGHSVDFFTYGDSALSTSNHNNYRNFSGTSLSAAVTSGMLALIFSQNKNISLEQAVDILLQETLAQRNLTQINFSLKAAVQHKSINRLTH
jgi:subtilisin family serine protease